MSVKVSRKLWKLVERERVPKSKAEGSSKPLNIKVAVSPADAEVVWK